MKPGTPICPVTVLIEEGGAFSGERAIPSVGPTYAEGHARVAERGATQVRDARVVESHPPSAAQTGERGLMS
jgi:hypothetical protein